MDDDDKNPPNPTDPPNDPPPPPAPSGESDLRVLIDGLNSRVNELEGLVNNAITGEKKDSTPVSRPWTHRGFSKR